MERMEWGNDEREMTECSKLSLRDGKNGVKKWERNDLMQQVESEGWKEWSEEMTREKWPNAASWVWGMERMAWGGNDERKLRSDEWEQRTVSLWPCVKMMKWQRSKWKKWECATEWFARDKCRLERLERTTTKTTEKHVGKERVYYCDFLT